jgi:SsrA-binding protein
LVSLGYHNLMKISNKKALYEYEIQDKFEAGINLTGPEVKAVKLGNVDLAGSFVKIIGSEAYLVNAKIYAYRFARLEGHDERRTRKLLLHKREILNLRSKMDGANLTIVPVSVYTKRHLIKIELAVAKGKKKFDKKEALRKRDIERDTQRALEDFVH